MKKPPKWFSSLSAPVRAAVEAHVAECGYVYQGGRVDSSGMGLQTIEHDFDGWLTDMLTTAFRSPKGHILRFKRKGDAPPAAPVERECELPLGGGTAAEGQA